MPTVTHTHLHQEIGVETNGIHRSNQSDRTHRQRDQQQLNSAECMRARDSLSHLYDSGCIRASFN